MEAGSSRESVRKQVEALRQKLLDLTLRNRMLNFRLSKRLGLSVIGEDSEQVHRILVEESRKMTFTGKPDPPKREKAGPDPLRSFDDPVAKEEFRQQAVEELSLYLENPHATVSQTDTRLTTDEFESALQAKLRTIAREASVANEELGIDTLFLTLGMLEWREANAERTCKAPLLFLPVSLERQSNGNLRVVHTGGDVGDNLPLRAKLQEFNLRLPAYDDEQGVRIYFEAVSTTVRGRNDWSVLPDEITLGFFNYEKYAMYVDLGGEAWPEERKPWLHPDVVAMLGSGYEPPESAIGDDTFLDTVRPAAECNEVYDADSSQTLAMIRAAAGLSVIVEGPPGTGKSQTITNIIAEAVAAEKRVLFVSAKRAALEVVKRRLEEAGLGAICLDLHDKLTNRREFYAELRRTADLSLTVRSADEKVARLSDLRERLNAHADAMNSPLPGYGCTPFQAMARLGALHPETAEDRQGRVDYQRLREFPETEIRRQLPSVEALQSRLRELEVPPLEHPFWGIGLDRLDPGLQLDLREDLTTALQAQDQALAAVEEVAAAFGVPPPATFASTALLRACLERVVNAPSVQGVSVGLNAWHADEPEVRAVFEQLRVRAECRKRREAQVLPSAWETDWTAIQQVFQENASRWYSFVVGEYRRARRTLAAHLSPSGPRDAQAQLELLADLVQERRSREAVIAANERLGRLFGNHWRGVDSDPQTLASVLEWVLTLHRDAAQGAIPPALIEYFVAEAAGTLAAPLRARNDPQLAEGVNRAEAAVAEAVKRYGVVAAHLRVEADLGPETLVRAKEEVQRWLEALPTLRSYLDYANVRRQALSQGLEAAVEVADRWSLAAERLEVAFQRAYYEGLLREAMSERPALRDFERNRHEAAITEYQSLDDFKLTYNRAWVRLGHQRRLPSFAAAVGNLLILRQQCELQRRHKPIRWIMARAGEAVMRLKPVFMMSPLSTAIHLPPECPPFDLVIFDEASQVRPEDAFSAIIRGKQTIVVGDTRQMPPTSFFDRVTDDEELDEEAPDEAAELGQEARKLESILSMMSAVALGRARRPDLRWHYRSLHPALIQPSNELFYDNRLVIFPSASGSPAGRPVGVVYHHLPETAYEGGERKRINRGEAEQVVEAVVRHLRNFPEESLMVAAMNKPQADLIYDLLQIRERQEPESFQQYRTRHPYEPLDVKNLENVQGDERDVVFISVTYGRDASGTVRQNFGPLLRDGGERRLNVLITRARRRCELFTNLTADDIRVEGPRPGLAAFQRYLRFAATGDLRTSTPTGEEPDSPFEEEVLAAVRAAGYEVDAQVGSEGYRIDLAVRSPEEPGRYLLGVECDGATYHSARSARDRDKLRQRVLEARGWRLHRIWSSNWWQNREGEIARLMQAIEAALETAVELPTPAADTEDIAASTDLEASEDHPAVVPTEGELDDGPAEDEIVVESSEASPPSAKTATTRAYVVAPPLEGEPTKATLAQYATEIVAVEGPIHEELLLHRLRLATGYARAGANVRAMLEEVLKSAERSKKIRRAGDGWISPDSTTVAPRDWSGCPAAQRKVEYVPSVEIAVALRQILANAFGIARADTAREAWALLGFRRVSEKTLERALAVLQELVDAGEIEERDGALWVPLFEV